MGAPGRADQPAGRAAVEAGVAVDGHHEVDLAVRMHVVRAGDVLHVDDIDRESMKVGRGLEDPPVADPAALAVAQPAGGHAGLAAGAQLAVGAARRPVFTVEPFVERAVQGPPGDLRGERGQVLAEIVHGHLCPPRGLTGGLVNGPPHAVLCY
jgi:hypothetical protein